MKKLRPLSRSNIEIYKRKEVVIKREEDLSKKTFSIVEMKIRGIEN